ncbi:hypothetical protein [Streptomyces sp. NPDC007100]|uniref:hypothetical protein n=1 Tax=Streptomyces sp. NPDC007100 TaxID=3155602 RepID=UPI0033DDB297
MFGKKKKGQKNSTDQRKRGGSATHKRRKAKYDSWSDAEKVAVMTSGIYTS